MIWPAMYLEGVAKQNGTKAEKWVGRSKKMETLFRMIDQVILMKRPSSFVNFRGEMNYIQEEFGRCPVFRIDGAVPKEESA
jgi:hypothetical protein